jgi:hypothetical protein
VLMRRWTVLSEPSTWEIWIAWQLSRHISPWRWKRVICAKISPSLNLTLNSLLPVDGYGVHAYPSGDPKIPLSARIDALSKQHFAMCSRAKPCWLTEWGFGNRSQDARTKEDAERVAAEGLERRLKSKEDVPLIEDLACSGQPSFLQSKRIHVRVVGNDKYLSIRHHGLAEMNPAR